MALTKVRGLGLGTLDDNITFSTAGKGIHLGVTSATASKVIFKDKIREVRGPLLAAEDVVYMKVLEAADSSAQAASVTKKKALRDAPAAKAISDADTIAKLKAAWDTSVLGDSPYA